MINKSGNIVLIGFMGCGKTTFGRWLSERCNMGFLDTDDYIEQSQGRKIKDIFSESGEVAFRDMETDAIKQLMESLEDSVVSVGGGLPVREINRKLLGELGMVVYLETSEDELVKRLENDTDRPLLAGSNLRERIRSLMEARENIYKDAADVIVTTDGMSFEDMYGTIRAAAGLDFNMDDSF